MKYKLLAVDMDGTLLNSQKQISKKNIEAIEKAISQGVQFVISTGRPIQGIKKFKELSNITCPLITYNGSMIIDPKTEEILFETKLKNVDAERLFKLGCDYNTTIMIWSQNKLYSNKINEKTDLYCSYSSVPVTKIENITEILNDGITKIVWFDEPNMINKFLLRLKNEEFTQLSYFTSQPCFIEFCNSLTSKGLALKFVGNKLGVAPEEMIAVGDGLNDVSMIEFAGLGVAMQNAYDEVKQKADYITTSLDEDGIANVVEKFIL